MATSLTLTRSIGWSGNYDNSGDTGQPGGKMPIAVTQPQIYTDGSSDNQGDVIIFKRASATASADTYDLTGGLTDIYGNAVTLAKIREIWIHNLSSTSGQLLTIGGLIMAALLGGTTETAIVHPGGDWMQAAPVDGYTVTGTTQDTLTVDPGANTISYDLRILGVKT